MPSDFTNETEVAGVFVEYELDEGVDFVPTGDAGAITVSIGWGDSAWGSDPWGGYSTTTLNSPTTIWTNIDTP